MIAALVLSLGVLNASGAGLATFGSTPRPGLPALLGQRTILAELHSTTDPGLPGPPRRIGLSEADSKEGDDELVLLWLEPTSSVRNGAAGMPRQDHLAATRHAAGGLLHELHHSWQLRC
jgi:hypothetical protein